MNRTEPPTPRQAAEAMEGIEDRLGALRAAGLRMMADGMASDVSTVRSRLDALEADNARLRAKVEQLREQLRYH